MKLTIDKKNNVAYLYLTEKENFRVVKTIELKESGGINVDIIKDGTIAGIEFLNAKDQLKSIIGRRKISIEPQYHSRIKAHKVLESA